MKFFKKNSYEIVRLFVIQIGITIFSLLVSPAARTVCVSNKLGATTSAYVQLAIGIFSTAFHLFIVYATMWEVGAKRREAIESGRMPSDTREGLKIALYSQAVNFFLWLLMAVGLLRLATGNSFLIGMYGVARLIFGLINSMHLGLINFFVTDINYVATTLLSLVFLLPQIVVASLAYAFGTKGWRITKATPPSRE